MLDDLIYHFTLHVSNRDMQVFALGFLIGVLGTLSRIAFALPRIIKEIF